MSNDIKNTRFSPNKKPRLDNFGREIKENVGFQSFCNDYINRRDNIHFDFIQGDSSSQAELKTYRNLSKKAQLTLIEIEQKEYRIDFDIQKTSDSIKRIESELTYLTGQYEAGKISHEEYIKKTNALNIKKQNINIKLKSLQQEKEYNSEYKNIVGEKQTKIDKRLSKLEKKINTRLDKWIDEHSFIRAIKKQWFKISPFKKFRTWYDKTSIIRKLKRKGKNTFNKTQDKIFTITRKTIKNGLSRISSKWQYFYDKHLQNSAAIKGVNKILIKTNGWISKQTSTIKAATRKFTNEALKILSNITNVITGIFTSIMSFLSPFLIPAAIIVMVLFTFASLILNIPVQTTEMKTVEETEKMKQEIKEYLSEPTSRIAKDYRVYLPASYYLTMMYFFNDGTLNVEEYTTYPIDNFYELGELFIDELNARYNYWNVEWDWSEQTIDDKNAYDNSSSKENEFINNGYNWVELTKKEIKTEEVSKTVKNDYTYCSSISENREDADKMTACLNGSHVDKETITHYYTTWKLGVITSQSFSPVDTDSNIEYSRYLHYDWDSLVLAENKNWEKVFAHSSGVAEDGFVEGEPIRKRIWYWTVKTPKELLEDIQNDWNPILLAEAGKDTNVHIVKGEVNNPVLLEIDTLWLYDNFKKEDGTYDDSLLLGLGAEAALANVDGINQAFNIAIFDGYSLVGVDGLPSFVDGGQWYEIVPGCYMKGFLPSSDDLQSNPMFNAIWTMGQQYLGYPYVWGGSNPSTSFDCSGLVYWLWNATGYNTSIGRLGSTSQLKKATDVKPISQIEEIEPGDLIWFGYPSEVGTLFNYNGVNYTTTHIAIYIGKDENGAIYMLHAISPCVTISTLATFNGGPGVTPLFFGKYPLS